MRNRDKLYQLNIDLKKLGLIFFCICCFWGAAQPNAKAQIENLSEKSPVHIVILFDKSQSMAAAGRPELWKNVSNFLMNILGLYSGGINRPQKNISFAFIPFDKNVLEEEILPFGSSAEMLGKAFETGEVQMTDFVSPLLKAFEILNLVRVKNTEARQFIFLLSDGLPDQEDGPPLPLSEDVGVYFSRYSKLNEILNSIKVNNIDTFLFAFNIENAEVINSSGKKVVNTTIVKRGWNKNLEESHIIYIKKADILNKQLLGLFTSQVIPELADSPKINNSNSFLNKTEKVLLSIVFLAICLSFIFFRLRLKRVSKERDHYKKELDIHQNHHGTVKEIKIDKENILSGAKLGKVKDEDVQSFFSEVDACKEYVLNDDCEEIFQEVVLKVQWKDLKKREEGILEWAASGTQAQHSVLAEYILNSCWADLDNGIKRTYKILAQGGRADQFIACIANISGDKIKNKNERNVWGHLLCRNLSSLYIQREQAVQEKLIVTLKDFVSCFKKDTVESNLKLVGHNLYENFLDFYKDYISFKNKWELPEVKMPDSWEKSKTILQHFVTDLFGHRNTLKTKINSINGPEKYFLQAILRAVEEKHDQYINAGDQKIFLKIRIAPLLLSGGIDAGYGIFVLNTGEGTAFDVEVKIYNEHNKELKKELFPMIRPKTFESLNGLEDTFEKTSISYSYKRYQDRTTGYAHTGKPFILDIKQGQYDQSKNPFISTRPLGSGDPFTGPGRKLIEEWKNKFESLSGGVFWLRGLRRMGKTSFLRRFHKTCELDGTMKVIEINCRSFVYRRTTLPVENFWHTIFYQMKMQLNEDYFKNNKGQFEFNEFFNSKQMPTEVFFNMMDTVLNKFASKNISLYFDDADYFTEKEYSENSDNSQTGEKNSSKHTLIKDFKTEVIEKFSEYTLRPRASGFLYVVFVSEFRFMNEDNAKLNSIESRANLDGIETKRLTLLEPEHTEELLTKYLPFQYTDIAKSFLDNFTGGYPVLVQEICKSLFDDPRIKKEKKIKLSDIRRIAQGVLGDISADPLRQKEYQYIYKYSFTRETRSFLSSLLEDLPRAPDQISPYIEKKCGHLDTKMKLLNLQVFRNIENHVFLRLEFFREIIKLENSIETQ